MAILLISPEPWHAHTVSKHHYARTLAEQGHRVLFLEPPDPQLRGLRLEPVPDQPRLQRVQAPRVAPGLRWLQSPLRRWLEHRWLRQLESRTGCRIDVIWLFENSRFYDLRFAGARLKIYHQVDLNQNFQPAIAARTADICFCTSELIRQRLLPHNRRCYRLQHGVAPPSAVPYPWSESDEARLRHDRPQVAYVGNLAIPYLDWEVVIEVVEAHPHVQFHLVGRYDSGSRVYQRLRQVDNVTWWGQVSSAMIPALLERMDILMLCYSQRYQDQVSNPHKLMEYLASGRTVVATYTEEYSEHPELLAMTQPCSNAGYSELFTFVLSQLHIHNSPERIASRQAFAADHTYPRQLERIQALLQQHGYSLPAPSNPSVLP